MNVSGLTVLCVGDVMLDRFVYGTMERISPEAPVPVIRRNHVSEMLGGAGNVANNIVALGGRVILVGLVGHDETARRVSDLLGKLDGMTNALVRSTVRSTICKTRFIAANQQVLRIDEESAGESTQDEQDQLAEVALGWIGQVDAVVLSDYAKGVLAPALVRQIIEAAVAAGVPVHVDPKAADFSRFRGACCVKPNLKELALASGMPTNSEDAIVAAARSVMTGTGLDTILVTRSEDGMILVTPNEAHRVRGRVREVFDVSGAGDTVIAALALCHAAGRTLVQAMHMANAAAGVVVGKLGTATVSMDEVLAELSLGDAAAPRGLQPVATARKLVARWKQDGMVVGFTNGCFDILHTGHVALLTHARSTCDRLVVALNSDESVRGLKGPTRPVNTVELRARVIAALRDVDCVVQFDEPTPLALIRDLMPDVLVKGADYAPEGVVGGDLVTAAGGRVVLAPFVAGQSTTRLMAEIRQPHPGEVASPA